MVRVPQSTSLDLNDAMTLAAWVRPTASQAGWRTALHRQTDAYFLMAQWGWPVNVLRLWMPRARVPWSAQPSASVRRWAFGWRSWIGGEHGSWWPPLALFVVGALVDALAPSVVLIAPVLVAIWLAVMAPDRVAS